MKKWEVLIIPAIALVVWILTSLFRRDEPPPQPRRRFDPTGDKPRQQRRPVTQLDRTLEEARRRREGPARREPARPQPTPVVLELFEPQPPPTPLEVTRAKSVRTPAPSKVEAVQPLVEAALVVAETKAVFVPAPAPSKPVVEKLSPASSPIVQVRQLLRSPKSAAAALVLREILDEPRCRRRVRA